MTVSDSEPQMRRIGKKKGNLKRKNPTRTSLAQDPRLFRKQEILLHHTLE
jgi:hypothetical protein